MIKGSANVLEFFSTLNKENDQTYIYWTVYKKGTVEKGYPTYAAPTDREGWNFQQAYEMLQKWLGWQQFGEFTLIVNDSNKVSSRGAIKQDFTIDTIGQPVQVSGPAFNPEEIEARIQKGISEALERKEQERELKELREKAQKLEAENKKLQKAADSPMNVLIGEIKPYLPDLLQEAGIIKSKVAGVPASTMQPVRETNPQHPANDQEIDIDVQTRLETVVGKFHTARPDDWLELLELMADALVKNPSLADTVKKFI